MHSSASPQPLHVGVSGKHDATSTDMEGSASDERSLNAVYVHISTPHWPPKRQTVSIAGTYSCWCSQLGLSVFVMVIGACISTLDGVAPGDSMTVTGIYANAEMRSRLSAPDPMVCLTI